LTDHFTLACPVGSAQPLILIVACEFLGFAGAVPIVGIIIATTIWIVTVPIVVATAVWIVTVPIVGAITGPGIVNRLGLRSGGNYGNSADITFDMRRCSPNPTEMPRFLRIFDIPPVLACVSANYV
jgi:hypothetical protein